MTLSWTGRASFRVVAKEELEALSTAQSIEVNACYGLRPIPSLLLLSALLMSIVPCCGLLINPKLVIPFMCSWIRKVYIVHVILNTIYTSRIFN
jgi:hypothetical protein